jgi:hypothetical protein
VRSTVSGNHTDGFGGGVSAFGVTLDRTTVTGNTANGNGGGLAANGATLLGSTVSGNSAGGNGGGVSAVTANLTNSTVSGNTANTTGGGIHVERGGTILSSTIAFNHADGFGGGIENAGGTAVHVKNTIIAKNDAVHFGQDVLGLFLSDGHNLVQDPHSGNANTSFTDPLNQDILGVDQKLGALANNGGPTQTHALLAGSPAIDQGDNSGAPATDQRGLSRIKDGDGDGRAIVDIGAFEL